MIGAARAALEEYEQIIPTKLTYFPPQVPRYTHPDYQRTYGHALALTDAAEAIVLRPGPLHGAGRTLGARPGSHSPARTTSGCSR